MTTQGWPEDAMGSVEVIIVTPAAHSIAMDLPRDTVVRRLVAGLVERLDLPSLDDERRELVYSLRRRSTGKLLSGHESLAQAAISSGEELLLESAPKKAPWSRRPVSRLAQAAMVGAVGGLLFISGAIGLHFLSSRNGAIPTPTDTPSPTDVPTRAPALAATWTATPTSTMPPTSKPTSGTSDIEVAIAEHVSQRGEGTVLDQLILDLDGDAEEEALVLASYPAENFQFTGVALLLDWDGSSYRDHPVGEIGMRALDAGSIDWQDLNADGENEIVLDLEGYLGTGGQINHVRSALVFAYHGGETIELARVVPSHILPVITIEDVDDDPVLEIILEQSRDCPVIFTHSWRLPPWIQTRTTYDWNGHTFEPGTAEASREDDYFCMCEFLTSLREGDYQRALDLTMPSLWLADREIGTEAQLRDVIEEKFAALVDPQFSISLTWETQFHYEPGFFILASTHANQPIAQYSFTLEEVQGVWRIAGISEVTDSGAAREAGREGVSDFTDEERT